jgi:hypothetical protein
MEDTEYEFFKEYLKNKKSLPFDLKGDKNKNKRDN